MSTAGSPDLRHAIVLGGGICGLATAGVLSRHFERVTVIEPDRYGEAGVPRRHAPLGAHIHILLAGGLMTLTRLVPALRQCSISRGCSLAI
jgi:phytoene dehydrogenase-like protein